MNTREDNNGAALKAWKKLSPGHIAKPLRHIGSRLNTRSATGEVVFHPDFISGQQAAGRGDGRFVTALARSL